MGRGYFKPEQIQGVFSDLILSKKQLHGPVRHREFRGIDTSSNSSSLRKCIAKSPVTGAHVTASRFS
jgi:hypothetical protein